MTRILIDEPAVLIAKFRITSYSRGRAYTTIETGRGRLFNAKRDVADGLLNATYNAVYKHVNKPRGKSDPKVEKLSVDIDYPVGVTRRGLRLSRVNRKGGRTQEVWRDSKGRFAKPPRGRRLSDKEIDDLF